MDNKDLEYLKSDYMNQEYPDDLGDFVLSAIARQARKDKYIKSNKVNYIKFALVACLFIMFLPSIFRNRIDTSDENLKLSRFSNVSSGNTFNSIFENETIISIYPNDSVVKFSDTVYNIDKLTGNFVYLSDIVVEEIDYLNIDDEVKRAINDSESKFYINQSGMYVILTNSSEILIDDELKYKIIKQKYLF